MKPKRKALPPKILHVAGYLLLWLVVALGIWWTFAGAGTGDPGLVLYRSLFVMAVGVWLVILTYRFIVRSRLEPPQLNVLNARPHLGEHVTFDVRLTARKPVTVRKVVVMLTCTEEVRKARRHERILPVVVSRGRAVLAEKLRLTQGEPVDVPGEIVLPADGMQSFESHLCAVRWQLDVLIYVGRHLTYHEREVLSVQPVRLETPEVIE
ncbi:MAG TPA: hypothetical protein VMZ92_08825 [Planctomycetota bacterium]|nr:hypothetical protein [Planctomycetota bacterium]